MKAPALGTNGLSNGAPRPQVPPLVTQPPAKKRKVREGVVLSPEQRDTLIGAVAKHGRDRVITDLGLLAKDRTRHAVYSIVKDVERDHARRWNATTLSLLDRLVKFYRSGNQAELGIPDRVPVRPVAPQAHQQSAALALSQGIPGADPNLINTIAATVKVVLEMMQGHSPSLPKLPPVTSARVEHTEPESRMKGFEELHPNQQRRILHSMHTRYGAHLREQGVFPGEHGAAWDHSYAAYESATGESVREIASARSDSTGTRVKPLDVIEEKGDLVRFWHIVRNLWERGA